MRACSRLAGVKVGCRAAQSVDGARVYDSDRHLAGKHIQSQNARREQTSDGTQKMACAEAGLAG